MDDYTITDLDISEQELTHLPFDIDNYTNLKILNCEKNELTSLDNLPQSLETLDSGYNKLTNLDNLPPNLVELNCRYNKLTSLDNLPTNLQKLDYCGNPLTYDFEPTLDNIRKYNATKKLSSNT